MSRLERLKELNPLILLVITAISSIGFLMLYSAADGNIFPWAFKQMLRFAFGMGVLFLVCLCDLRTWYTVAYLFYGVSIILLIAVELMGFVGMGGQRWLDLYVFNLQPSELMKIGLVLALARYFHSSTIEDIRRTKTLILPLTMILCPMLLVMRQPDLGTAMMLLICGVSVIFLAGVQLWKFIVAGALGAASLPILWHFLYDYQKKRILVFLNPESDPMHSGYHVMQSKIALGSGGFWGKGFMHGSQAHLNFLPEKQTDFIFTMFCEEFGMLGALTILFLYAVIIIYCYSVALKSRSPFAKLLTIGLVSILFFYMFINMAMVMGLVPVVGVPLPLVSYGGTSMLTVLFSLGLIFSARIFYDTRLGSL